MKTIEKIYNVETNQETTFERDMTEQEVAVYNSLLKEIDDAEKEKQLYDQQQAILKEKLKAIGLTDDEILLILKTK
jgi:hypothetical protein